MVVYCYIQIAMKKARFSHFIMNVPEHLNNEWLACFPKECFSVRNPPYSYNTKESQLEAKIYSHLSQHAPKLMKEITTINNVSKFVIDEHKFKCWIVEPFEYFICGKDPSKGFEELRKINKPPNFCGRLFKVGDPTYTCKDCAADPTCVFCHDCFHQSVHTKHKYKLYASQGRGGYCDCGDKEAWTNDPACNKHKENTNEDAKDPLVNLPEDVYNYATFLFTVLLKYCIDMVYWRINNSLPSPLTIESNDENSHIVMLFNDEIHSYKEVITALQKSIKATEQQGFHLAAVVDKEGRSAIFNGNMTESVSVAVTCKIHTSKNKAPLRCEAIHKDVIAHQLCAIEIMSWLANVVDKSDALRRLLCLLVCKPLCDRPVPLLAQVINDDAQLWKAARLQVHQLFVNSLLMDISYGRVEFAIAFAKNYVKMINDFIEDDHDHSLSVSALSVQIFTVPSIAELLILEHDILAVCLETFLVSISPAVGVNGSLDFQGKLKFVNLKRSEYILNDIRYLLRMKPKWTELLREKFIAFFHHFLQLLKIMQGMDSVTHKVLSHVAYEPNWESGFNLQLWCMSLFHEMYIWCYSDKEVLSTCTGMCLKVLNELPLQYIAQDKFIVFADYNIKTMQVSIHAPLSRFIAGLLCGMVKQNLSIEEHIILNLNNTIDEKARWQQKLIEFPLRALVLMAQVNASMWKRNGFSILNTVIYYQNIRFTCEMYDRDIQLLQMVASCMDSDYFIDSLLYKYDLAAWVSKETKENLQAVTVIAEEFFLTLFYILSERYVIGIGETTYKEILTREVIHRLAIGPSSRSNLVKHLPAADPEDDDSCSFESLLDEVLNEVADYREPGLTGKGLFCLKTAQMHLCNQFFIHYTKIDRSKVLEERNVFLKKSNDTNVTFLAMPPRFLPKLESILKLLHSEKLAFLLKLVLNRALSMKMVTVEIIEVTLLIIAVGLLETKRARNSEKFDFNFLGVLLKKNNDEFSLSELIEDLLTKQSSKEFQKMIKWIKLLIEEEMVCSTIHKHNLKFLPSEDDSVQDDKAKKLMLSKERKERLIAQMNKMQTDFMKYHHEMFENDLNNKDVNEDISYIEDISLPIAIGYKRSHSEENIQQAQCILCQEEQLLDNENSFIVMVFVNESSVFHFQNKRSENLQPSFCDNSACINVSSCGHIAHGKCWDKYYTSRFSTSASTFFSNRLNTIDVSKTEFLCPLCNSLCNSVLPLLPRIVESLPVSEDTDLVSLTELLAYMDKFSSELSRNQTKEIKQTGLLQTCVKLPQKIFYAYVGWHEKTPNFMELFLKKLLKLSSASSSTVDDIPISSAVPLSWMACSFTLQALECQFRTAGKNMFFNVSERRSLFINSFVNLLQSSCVIPSYTHIEEFAEKIFNFFCGKLESDISIVTLDVFGVMISLRFIVTAVQHLFQSSVWFPFASHLLDDVAFKLCLNTYIIKCFITAPLYLNKDHKDGELTADTDIPILTENENEVVKTFATLKSFCGIQIDTQQINGHLLKKHVVDSLLPFLRCSAYFFHFLTGVKIPESLKTECICDELFVLLTYLNIPVNIDELLTLNWLMQEEKMIQITKRWCEHKDVYNLSSIKIEKCYFTARRLITLPHDYSSLINMASGFRCPTTGDSNCIPSLCLVCGELLCSQCYCCQTENENQYGACVLHSVSCSNSVGIFFIVRQSEIVLLYNHTLGMMIPSPYLDQYGEADRGFRRGNPLFLNEKRYESLEKIWISQQIPETIVRKIETDRSLLSNEWSRY
ncbi:E3 ubiquitin-protein ligase UBR2 isoform X2 [Hydra vulgaris]|uniref:E3 ubiquitin-protein ligase n=1 Tax=Hydra vulgaris TaxID=6087 RepID=A0ABM4CJ68_HYDVU